MHVHTCHLIIFSNVFPQKDEASLVYSAPTFIKRKAGKAERRNAKAAEREIVYSDVRAFGLD